MTISPIKKKKKKGERFGHFTKDIPTANTLSENAKHH